MATFCAIALFSYLLCLRLCCSWVCALFREIAVGNVVLSFGVPQAQLKVNVRPTPWPAA